MILKARKAVFIFCIIISSVLFIDGLYTLGLYGKAPGYGRSEINNRIMQREQTDGSCEKLPVNLLMLGMDGEELRSDVILMFNYSPERNALNILSFARDTKVTAGGRTSKINALEAIGGIPLVIRQIEELTGLPVNYYLTMNFKGFRQIVDLLDGVTVNVPFDMDYDDSGQDLHIHLQKGLQVLDGVKAEQFVRYRKGNRPGQGYTDGDIGRIGAQQDFLRALIDQKLKLKYLSKADDVFLILKENMGTNIEIGDLRYYLKDVQNLGKGKISTFTAPGESVYTGRTWYFIVDREKTLEIVNENFYK